MVPPDGAQQSIHEEFINIMGENIPAEKLKRFDFYNKSRSPETFMVIATGEIRRFANILIVTGVVKY